MQQPLIIMEYNPHQLMYIMNSMNKMYILFKLYNLYIMYIVNIMYRGGILWLQRSGRNVFVT